MKQKDFTFPDVEKIKREIVTVGGCLSPHRILQAYRSGIFPWFEDDNYILWWAPNKRMVVRPENVKISTSLLRALKKRNYSVKIDENFSDVIQHCSTVIRKHQSGSWITADMKKAYKKLHQMGYAHSIEIYQAKKLVSGLYGLAIGKIFCGESMFSLDNSSKIAFVFLALFVETNNLLWIASQKTLLESFEKFQRIQKNLYKGRLKYMVGIRKVISKPIPRIFSP